MKPVDVKPEHIKRLRDLEVKMRAVQEFSQMVTQQGTEMLKQYHAMAADVWRDIAKDTGIDLQNVVWQPHPLEDVIFPVQAKFATPTLNLSPHKAN